MVKFKINKQKIIPDIEEYLKILLSAIITVYILKAIILLIFPQVEFFSDFVSLIFWVFLITYIKDLVTIKVNNREYI